MTVARVLFYAAGIAVLGLGMYPGLLGDGLFPSIFIACGIVAFFFIGSAIPCSQSPGWFASMRRVPDRAIKQSKARQNRLLTRSVSTSLRAVKGGSPSSPRP